MIHKLARQNWKLFVISSITEFHKLARINESDSFFEKISVKWNFRHIDYRKNEREQIHNNFVMSFLNSWK